MPEPSSIQNDFISKASKTVYENLTNEQFGVSELAHELGMSRSNLLRKIKKLTNQSASQFIRQLRLQRSFELLTEQELTVSEVSFKVGFSSTSYYIKCFRNHYGYSPGEVGKRVEPDHGFVQPVQIEESADNQVFYRKKKWIGLLWLITFITLIISAYLIYNSGFLNLSGKFIDSDDQSANKKSIAVLPFINDSNDSTNIYLINGLMESILNNLQNLEGLRVVSRTSVEKYRNNPKTIAEIAKELKVDYFVEGSGQKVDDNILLNVQLIEASTDQNLWGEQYSREVNDIFKIQQEVAKNIARKIEVIVTPEEEARINKVPTDDLIAYDHFLKGLDLLYQGNSESLLEAINWYEKAIERDDEFARAYAGIAVAYYFLDAFQLQKQYSDKINYFADKALLLDSKLPQSLIAKALFYLNAGENEMAVPYLEKALEYNPNSALVINILSDFYARYVPNTTKYLEYALKGIQLDIASHDSVTASFIYLHLSNAFIQSGFVDEAEFYINKSLEYYPDNLYSEYVKAYILYASDFDLKQLKNRLIIAFEKDTTRLDILQEIAKTYYFMGDYESANKYYKPFSDIRVALNLDIYRSEDAKIAVTYAETGNLSESEKYLTRYKEYADYDKSIYKDLSLSAYYSYINEPAKAIEHLKLFAQQDDYHYWIILFLEMDPLMDNINGHRDFKRIFKDIENKFQENHKQIKATLEMKGLI